MATSRCYIRRIGRDSPNLPESGKSTSLHPLAHLALLGRSPGPAPPNQPTIPPNADLGAVQRKVSHNLEERFLAPGYACAPHADWLSLYHDTVLPKGAHFWYKGEDWLWWLGKISASTTEDKVYLVRFFLRPGTNQTPSYPGPLHDFDGSRTSAWCLEVHIANVFPQGIQCNVDESRGEVVASLLSSRHRSSIVLHILGL